MNDKLLYFPYINIPANGWTIKSLLYWDSVGIIVPPKFAENPKRYNQFTIDLLQTDLVEQIFPANYVRQVQNFDNGFIELVQQPKFNLERRQTDFARGIYSRIHIQKFGDILLNLLVELGIARRENGEWYYVESRTANLIMLYLASVIGKTGKFTPATDDIRNLDISITQRGLQFRLNKERQKLLDDLIPYPINPDLTALRKFKDKYYEELKSFRILLEQAALEISKTRFSKHKKEQHKLKVTEILDRKEKVLSDLNQSKFGQITFGTICGLGGAIYGFSQDNTPLALFSLANAIYSAFQGYDNAASLTKDFSYLALIDKKLKSE